MSRALAAVVVAVLAAVAPAAAPAAPLAPATLTLRLPDLAPGYGLSDGVGCTPRRVRDDGARLGLGSVARLPHRGCEVGFEPVWTAPGAPRGPAFVGSGAFVFQDATGPQAALVRPRALVTYLTPSARDDLDFVEPAPAIGDEAVVLHDTRGWAAYVVWRSGPVLGIVGAAVANGVGDPVSAVVPLALAQQARISTPTPLAASDFDDLEVPLDDPGLEVPVIWTGRSLDGGPRLPRVRLQAVERLYAPDRSVALTYGPRRGVTAFQLQLLAPRALARATIRRELRRIRRDRCVRVERIPLTRGSATLFSSRHGCVAHTIDGPVAVVRLPGVRVGVVPEHGCAECTDRVTSWASAAGVRAVVRALRPR